MPASEANQRLLASACDTQTFRGIEGVQLTPAIPVKQRNVSSTEKSEGKTRNLIISKYQMNYYL